MLTFGSHSVQFTHTYHIYEYQLFLAVCDDSAEDKRRRESIDSGEDRERKMDDASSSKDDTEEQTDESSGRQRWKSTSGILASSEDDDVGKFRHSSTPGRSGAVTPGSAPLVESLAATASSSSNSVAEDHMARLRDAYSLFLTTSGMLVNMCKKKLGIDEEEGVGVKGVSAADDSSGENCEEEAGGARDAANATTDATKE